MRKSIFSPADWRLQFIVLLLSIAVAGVIVFGCGEDSPTKSGTPSPVNPSVDLIEHSDCTLMGQKSMTDNEKCIVVDYDGSDELRLTSIGSIFDCCPDSLSGSISYDNRVFSISEREFLGPTSGCDCHCPYDFIYHLSDVPPGTYTIDFEMFPHYASVLSASFTIYLPASLLTDTLCGVLESSTH